jgi:hypothetical protein
MRRRKRVLAQAADPGVVLGAVVAAAAIAGSLSLSRRMILRVTKKLVTRKLRYQVYTIDRCHP